MALAATRGSYRCGKSLRDGEIPACISYLAEMAHSKHCFDREFLAKSLR
jgi:hypothetical protein